MPHKYRVSCTHIKQAIYCVSYICLRSAIRCVYYTNVLPAKKKKKKKKKRKKLY